MADKKYAGAPFGTQTARYVELHLLSAPSKMWEGLVSDL